MRTFAGFWRDGDISKPNEKHADEYGVIVVKKKDDFFFDAIHAADCVTGFYWLDATTHKEVKRCIFMDRRCGQ